MALFLRPANVMKNVAANFQIDYAELAALPKVVAGGFSDSSKWKEIYVKVKHSGSGQKKDIFYTCPATQSSLLVSNTARSGSWSIDSILIRDFDRGEVFVNKQEILAVGNFDFFVVSAASHGDFIVPSGETRTLPSNADRQFGDFVVEAGGTLKVEDGGGILAIEVLGSCIINGTIEANNGKHTGGSWSKTSVLGESLNHTVTQKAGGAGGQGEELTSGSLTREPVSGQNYIVSNMAVQLNGLGDLNWWWNGVLIAQTPGPNAETYNDGIYTYYRGTFVENSGFGDPRYGIYRTSGELTVTPGGLGGATAFGNGGGGGRSAKFIAAGGGVAIDTNAGAGAGASNSADEYGEDGLDSTAPVYAGGGGFRGAHGQGLYIKATRIDGSGSIIASGQKGGDGGDGGEYLSEGELYANGPGGGGAGGDGGKVWLRANQGASALTINILGGERGARGLASSGATEASHGEPGAIGSYSFQLY